MPTALPCPHCAAQFTYKPEYAGRVLKCPKCNGSFQVPIPQATIPTAAPVAVQQRTLEAAPPAGKMHVITEKTSKRYKLMQLGGVAMIILGFVVLFSAAAINAQDAKKSATRASATSRSTDSTGIGIAGLACPMIFLGGVAYIGGRALAWWNHG